MVLPPALLPRGLAFSSAGAQGAIVAGPAIGGFVYAAGAGHRLRHLRRPLRRRRRARLRRPLRAGSARRRRRSRSRRCSPACASSATGRWCSARSRSTCSRCCSAARSALLPIFARDILHVGAWGLGLLRAAPAVGALRRPAQPVAPLLARHPHARFPAARLPRRELLAPLDPGQRCRAGSRAASSGSCAADPGRRLRAPRSRARRRGGSRGSGSAPASVATSPKLARQRRLVGVGPQRAQARRVDDAGAARQPVQRARRRRVHAAAVVLAHRAGVLDRGAEQGVGQRRLARARRAEQTSVWPTPATCANGARCAGSVASTTTTSTPAGRRCAQLRRCARRAAPGRRRRCRPWSARPPARRRWRSTSAR